MAAYNSVDYLVLAIFGISILAGLMRGFVKEVISLASWIVAGFVAMQFSSPLAAMFSGQVSSAAQGAVGSSVNVSEPISMLAIGGSFVALFAATLFAGAIVNYIVSGVFSAGGLGLVNRLLGGIFGAARGYIMVIIFMFIAELTPMGSQDAWSQSQFVQSFQPTVTWFADKVEPGLQYLKSKGSAVVDSVTGKAESGATNLMNSVK